jgi:hypothetical protein
MIPAADSRTMVAASRILVEDYRSLIAIIIVLVVATESRVQPFLIAAKGSLLQLLGSELQPIGLITTIINLLQTIGFWLQPIISWSHPTGLFPDCNQKDPAAATGILLRISFVISKAMVENWLVGNRTLVAGHRNLVAGNRILVGGIGFLLLAIGSWPLEIGSWLRPLGSWPLAIGSR